MTSSSTSSCQYTRYAPTPYINPEAYNPNAETTPATHCLTHAAPILIELAPEILARLPPGGVLAVSGVVAPQARSVVDAFAALQLSWAGWAIYSAMPC